MLRYLAAACVFAVLPIGALAQEPEAPAVEDMTDEQLADAYRDYVAETLKNVEPDHGTFALPGAPVTVTVPADLDFYDKAESRIILEDLWGNPEDDTVLGMIFPAGVSPADDTWGAVFTYEATGYVSDEDAASTDYSALLKDMQTSTRELNAYREKEGYDTAELVGWAVPPSYEAESHRVKWAKDLIFSSSDGKHTLNYDMRLLGRRGVLSVNFVGSMSDLDAINARAEEVLSTAAFNTGETYADYQVGDKTAGYGVAALIAGGVGVAAAKKIGVLGVALLFLKKGWIVIAALLAALGNRMRGMFGGGAKE